MFKRNLPWRACAGKFGFALVCMALVATFQNKLDPHMLAEKETLRLPFYKWWFYLYIITTFKRVQYYYVRLEMLSDPNVFIDCSFRLGIGQMLYAI